MARLPGVALAGEVVQSQEINITFDGPPFPEPSSARTTYTYQEEPLIFTSLSRGFTRVGADTETRPDNGTAFLTALFLQSLAFENPEGLLFNLVSVDLAEYSTVVPDAVTVPFVGYKADGTTVSTFFTTDGFIDGTGPGVDFETFRFGPEFSDLRRVEIPGYGWSMDNLVVSVPEARTSSMLIAAIACALFRKSRRKLKH